MQELRVCIFGTGSGDRVGSLAGDRIYDLNLCCAVSLAEARGAQVPHPLADTMVPSDLGCFIRGGDAVLSAARDALEWALHNEGWEGPHGERLYRDAGTTNLKAPTLGSTKVICMEVMYGTHLEMVGSGPPPAPTYFTKLSQVVVGPDEWVVIPKHHPEPMVYGTELTLVFGGSGRSIPAERALDHIWGYTVFNDVTLRGLRTGSGGKVFDTGAPVGPWIVPRDQVEDPHDLRLTFRINGRQVQDGTTRDLRYQIPEIVAEVSKWLTLEAGDIIATGDVGATEPVRPGDVMEAEVEGIGVLRNPVRMET